MMTGKEGMAFSLILGRSNLRDNFSPRPGRAMREIEAARIPSPSFCVIQYKSAGAYHCEGDAIRAAAAAPMLSSCKTGHRFMCHPGLSGILFSALDETGGI